MGKSSELMDTINQSNLVMKYNLLYLLILLLVGCSVSYVKSDKDRDEPEITEITQPLLKSDVVADLSEIENEIVLDLIVENFQHLNKLPNEEAFSPIFLIVFDKNPSPDIINYLNYNSGLNIEFRPASEGEIVESSSFYRVQDPRTQKNARYFGISKFSLINDTTKTVVSYMFSNSLDGYEEKLLLTKSENRWKITEIIESIVY